MTLFQNIAELCLSTLPHEACGVVVDGKAVLCRNTSDKPDVSFVISPEDYLRYRPTTIFHSHPTGDEGFSDHDLAVAANMELTSYVYIVEADRLERWSTEEGLEVFENVLKKR
jgi:proteasome lid subunit RPN8/RPN11